MGNLQRVAGEAHRSVNKPSKLAAFSASVGLSLLFFIVYCTTNWLASRHAALGTWYYDWERFIPFVPSLIIPYMSIDLFFAAAPFICGRKEELRAHVKRIIFAIVVAGVFFVAMPLRMAVARPVPTGWTAPIFGFLYGFDQPHNLFPSLHIAFLTVLAELYAARTKNMLRVALNVWFALVGFSTLLTYQHHFADVAGGFVLGVLCIYLFPREQDRPAFTPDLRIAGYYIGGAILAGGAAFLAWPWTAILLWPASAMAITATGYWKFGPAIYRKADGRLPLSTRLILGPCLIGQYLSLRCYRRECAAWNEVIPGVWIGARLDGREAAEAHRSGVIAVLDLTAEFSESRHLRSLDYRNIPILDLTGLGPAQMREAVEFIAARVKRGTVLVHCKIGYSRSAAAVGAFLMASGHAETVEDAVEQLRRARPTIIIRPEARAALSEFAAGFGSRTDQTEFSSSTRTGFANNLRDA